MSGISLKDMAFPSKAGDNSNQATSNWTSRAHGSVLPPVIAGTLRGPDALIELVAFHFTDGIDAPERDLPRSSSFVN